MATNLETKNNLERDEIKEWLRDLKNEIENNPIDERVYLEVKPAVNELLKEKNSKNLSVQILKNSWKIRLKSYWETCELDLKSNCISFIKWGKVTLIRELTGLLDSDRYSRYNSLTKKCLLEEFRKMDIINKAVYAYKKHPNNKIFYFSSGNFWQRLSLSGDENYFLKLDWEDIASREELYRAWFKKIRSRYKKEREEAQKKVLDILNKIVA